MPLPCREYSRKPDAERVAEFLRVTHKPKRRPKTSATGLNGSGDVKNHRRCRDREYVHAAPRIMDRTAGRGVPIKERHAGSEQVGRGSKEDHRGRNGRGATPPALKLCQGC